mgnify:CR=1 FL=1
MMFHSKMTHLQLAVLSHIENYLDTHGVSPTYQEITDEVGLSSKSHAHKIVKKLYVLGYVDMKPNMQRNITLVSQDGKQER